MKIAVLGAGLVGTASAYYLWRDGHDVEVFDAAPQPATVTSYANACLVSASRALPWPTPTARQTLWRSMIDANAPMRVTKWLDPALWRWGREFMGYANESDFARHVRAKLTFARFCQDELENTLAQTGIDCGYRRTGLLYVCRSEATLAAARARAALVGAHGVDIRVLARDEVMAMEPSLDPSTIVGGTFAVTDAQGDSRAFTRALAAWLAVRGVKFTFDATVTAKLAQRGRTGEIRSPQGVVKADAFVVALGAHTPRFARDLGVRIPIYPVKGFSVTVPVKDVSRAPWRGGICEDSLIAYCPLRGEHGPIMRITTGAVFAGQDNTFTDADFAPHRAHFEALFPGALDWSAESVEYWACQRPMTPSSLPILQQHPAARLANLYWNCGQGHIGWTMSCGSARVIADLIARRAPSFNLVDMQRL